MRNTGFGKSNGTFGEIMQGYITKEVKSFLVTLPIEMYSYAFYEEHPLLNKSIVIPKEKVKVLKLLNILEKQFNIMSKGIIRIQSSIPIGKGLASSSADLVAAARAFLSAYNIVISSEELALIVAKIEPTDAVMFDQSVAFFNQEGICLKELGSLPAITIFGVDEGGIVDTINFNLENQSDLLTCKIYEDKFNELCEAFEKKDIYAIGKIATESALLNQKKLPKKYLIKMLELKDKFNLPGIVVAHTGTYIGLIINNNNPNYNNILASLSKFFKQENIEYQLFYNKGFSISNEYN